MPTTSDDRGAPRDAEELDLLKQQPTPRAFVRDHTGYLVDSLIKASAATNRPNMIGSRQ